MQCFGVPKLPNLPAMKAVMTRLQDKYSVKTIQYQGALGHIYYANDISFLISQVSIIMTVCAFCLMSNQEMANPHVRPHLNFFPEDSLEAELGESDN